MNIKELIDRVSPPGQLLEKRLIRYLISEGLVPPPDTQHGPKLAEYGDSHVVAVESYLKLKAQGHSVTAIKRLEAMRLGVIPLADGISLQIAPNLLQRIVDPSPMQAELSAIVAKYLSEPETRDADDQAQK